jgi:hypothetical protein
VRQVGTDRGAAHALKVHAQDALDLAQAPRRAKLLVGQGAQRERRAELDHRVATVYQRVDEAPESAADLPGFGKENLGDAGLLVRRTSDQHGNGHQVNVLLGALADILDQSLQRLRVPAHLGAPNEQPFLPAQREVGSRLIPGRQPQRPQGAGQAPLLAGLVEDQQGGQFVGIDDPADWLVPIEFEIFEWFGQHPRLHPQVQDGAQPAKPEQLQARE